MLGVKVVYRNAQLEPVQEKTFRLDDYTALLKMDLMRVINDVEELGYLANGGAAKEDWSDRTWALFTKIKHKLLDKAGDVGRLPENIITYETGEGDGEDCLGSAGQH